MAYWTSGIIYDLSGLQTTKVKMKTLSGQGTKELSEEKDGIRL